MAPDPVSGPAARLAHTLSGKSGQELERIGVVAEGPAEVDVAVDRAGPEHEAPAELEGVVPGPVLAMAGGPRASPSGRVVAADQVEEARRAEAHRPVRDPALVDEERERDARLVPELPGVLPVAEADRGEAGALGPELGLVVADPRDVLPAEQSAVVAEKDEHGRVPLPEASQTDRGAVGVGEDDAREAGADRPRHLALTRAGIATPRSVAPAV